MKLLTLALLSIAGRAEAADVLLVGDPLNGKKLYQNTCSACHGEGGSGGRTGIALTDSGRMNLIRNDQMFGQIEKGEGLKKPKDHAFSKELKYLDTWDVIAYVRTLHMTLDQFFPQAGRYVSKEYTIDKFGLDRIKEAAGLALQGNDQKGAVFTFFDFEGEAGNLSYVPQDPIRLDHLKKKFKAGYLVFLPFEDGNGFKGEIGVAMDPKGVITKIAVEPKGGSGLAREEFAIGALDMLGEIKANDKGAPFFQRGVTEYPMIGDAVSAITQRELRLIFDMSGPGTIDIGSL